VDDAGGGRRGRRAAPTPELEEVLGRYYGIHLHRLHVGLPLLGRIHAVLQPVRASVEGRRPLFANYLDPGRGAPGEAGRGVGGAGGRRGEGTQAMPRQLVHGDFWNNNVGFRHGRMVWMGDLDAQIQGQVR